MKQTKRDTAAKRLKPIEREPDDEISGIHPSVPAVQMHVAIGAIGGGALHEEPVAVYATPYVLAGGTRVRSGRDYFLGTRFMTGIIPSVGWEDEMRADGLPAFMIDECQEYLARRAL